MSKTTRMAAQNSANKLSGVQRFGLYFFAHAKRVFVLWITLVLFGALSYLVLLRREGFPNIASPFSLVSGTYFVNDASKVDADIALPLSNLITQRQDVKKVHSSAGANFFSIQVEYKEGTDAAASSKAIKAEVERLQTIPATATAEYRALAVGKFSDLGDDLLLAVYGDANTTPEKLEQSGQKIVAYLKDESHGLSDVQAVHTFSLFRTGTDPTSGQPLSEQKAFDRVTEMVNGVITFYPSTSIGLKSKPNIDAIHLYDQTKTVVAKLNADPSLAGTTTVITGNYAENIRTQISSLQENLLGGLAAVLVISFLLISLRGGIATALSMATVLAITLGVLKIAGLSLNTITLFSLILCLGLIVDDTTIMVEAIDASHDADQPKRTIVSGAIKRVAVASTTGTLVTMLSFAPLLFVSGILGSFIRAIPITIMVSLAVSLLVSLSLVPFLARGLLLGGKRYGAHRNPIARGEAWLSRSLAGVIRQGTWRPRRVIIVGCVAIIISAAFFVSGILIFKKVKFNIFPNSKDSDGLLVSLAFDPGTTVSGAEAVADTVNARIASTLGSNLKSINYYASGSNTTATVYVNLISFHKRSIKSPVLLAQLQTALSTVPNATARVMQQDVGPPKGTFDVRIYTDNRAAAQLLSGDINTYLSGRSFKRTDGSSFSIVSGTVPNPTTVVRDNGKQYEALSYEFNADDVSALVTIAKNDLIATFPPERVASYGLDKAALQFNFGSEDQNQDSFKSMVLAFPILLIVMYLVMLIQFKSFVQPLLIFLAIPFSIFGIALGLYLTENPLSFFVLIGFFALIGISVNNTILLTDYINQGRRNGLGRFEAVAAAVQARFRPLITTSLTSVVALIPLAFSDPFWESLAVTLICGLLSSTFLVVIAFPYYYMAIELLRSYYSRKQFAIWAVLLIGGAVLVSAINKTYVVGYVLFYVLLAIIRTVILAWQHSAHQPVYVADPNKRSRKGRVGV